MLEKQQQESFPKKRDGASLFALHKITGIVCMHRKQKWHNYDYE
jgi:hypothetical protein